MYVFPENTKYPAVSLYNIYNLKTTGIDNTGKFTDFLFDFTHFIYFLCLINIWLLLPFSKNFTRRWQFNIYLCILKNPKQHKFYLVFLWLFFLVVVSFSLFSFSTLSFFSFFDCVGDTNCWVTCCATSWETGRGFLCTCIRNFN